MDSGWEMIQKVRFYIKDKRVSLNKMMPGISQDSTGKSALENFAHWLTQSSGSGITVRRQSMTGIEDMDAYLMRHVDAKKITTKK